MDSALILGKLIVGHLLSDFVFQSKEIAKKKKTSWVFLILHIVIVFFTMLVCTLEYVDRNLLLCISLIAICHVIDRIKGDSMWAFLFDQLFHLSTILGFSMWFGLIKYSFIQSLVQSVYHDYTIWVYVASYVFAIFFARYFIQHLFIWLGLIHPINNGVEPQVKPPISAYIGMIERALILTLALQNQYTAIGFVFTIKGIARKMFVERADENGEYFFLGTAISFFIAIVTAIGMQKIL